MSDRIDPGPGWRLLEVGEIRIDGDEFFRFGKWTKTSVPGAPILCGSYPTRRRIAEPRTVKAIATRATVRAVFPDGAVIADSIACETGLSEEMMQYASDRWNLASKHLSTSGARYIMLEIQREGEP